MVTKQFIRPYMSLREVCGHRWEVSNLGEVGNVTGRVLVVPSTGSDGH